MGNTISINEDIHKYNTRNKLDFYQVSYSKILSKKDVNNMGDAISSLRILNRAQCITSKLSCKIYSKKRLYIA